MGGTTSKPEPAFDEKRSRQLVMAAQAKQLADSLAALDLNGVANSADGSLRHSNVDEWETQASKVSIHCLPGLSGRVRPPT